MLLIAVALLAADLKGLTLGASSRQGELLVGEPLKITLRWKASRPVRNVAVEEPDFLFRSVLLSVNDGTGARLYREYPHELVEKPLVTRSFAAGEEDVVNLVFSRGGYLVRPGGEVEEGLLFPRKGEYSVTAVYVQDGLPSGVASNTLRFTVGEPSGGDREVLAEMRRDPWLVRADGPAPSQARAKALLERYPESRYLRLAKLERFQQQASALHNERDPVTGESVFHLGKEGLAEFRRQHYRRLAEEMLSEGDWGPFEEEALAFAGLYAAAGGDEATSTRVRKQLFDKYPLSATVKRIQETEAAPDDVDDEPPPSPGPPKNRP
jgi:hypothetical protein